MKVLLDHCTPATLRRYLAPHDVKTARQMGWNGLENGELLREAQHRFDVMISTDSNIKYQQNLSNFQIGLVVLRGKTNALPSLLELIPKLLELLPTLQPNEVHYLFTAEMQAAKESER